MIPKREKYVVLARLFAYPGEEYSDSVREVQAYLNKNLPEAGLVLVPFTECITRLNLREQQDIYLRSFEVQSVTTLDVGYIVFGDDYKRGELLVNLNREHETARIDCGNELADHLPNLLKLVAVLDDEELLNDLVKKIMAPALRSMRNGFEPRQIEARDKVYKRHHKTLLNKHSSFTIYKVAIQTLIDVLGDDFDIAPEEYHMRSGGFLGSIGQEIKIES